MSVVYSIHYKNVGEIDFKGAIINRIWDYIHIAFF